MCVHYIDIRVYICFLKMFWCLELQHAIAYVEGNTYYGAKATIKCVGAKDTTAEGVQLVTFGREF